ncbi:hypothetical protein C3L33_20238, partial [Rhododendron williamsianum]
MSILPLLKALIIISTFLHAQLVDVESSVERGQPTHNSIPNLISNQQQSQRLSSDAQEYLNAHNRIRRKKGVPPLNGMESSPNTRSIGRTRASMSVTPITTLTGLWGE